MRVVRFTLSEPHTRTHAPTHPQLLDVGCGHGATALHMAKHLGCESAVGVNISPFQVRSLHVSGI